MSADTNVFNVKCKCFKCMNNFRGSPFLGSKDEISGRLFPVGVVLMSLDVQEEHVRSAV